MGSTATGRDGGDDGLVLVVGSLQYVRCPVVLDLCYSHLLFAVIPLVDTWYAY